MNTMKHLITVLSCFICIQLFACCNKRTEGASNPNNVLNTDSMKLKITVGKNTFTATLYNNATVTAFKTRLPITINMRALNGNEKFFDLPNNLPANASNPGSLQAGDLMLYGSNTLVLFYKSFSTSYSYTPMGRIDDISGLTAALGPGSITVKYELSE
jgi:hypothetical protein